jgi:hypothetical protein
VASCDSVCMQSRCGALGLESPQASCVAGRCVVGFECDSTKVLCKVAPPQCPAGQVPLIAGPCWQGACVPAGDCASVSDCAACTGALACATFIERGGQTHHCYAPPSQCHGNFGCSCAGLAICPPPALSCQDLSGMKGIVCSCPSC